MIITVLFIVGKWSGRADLNGRPLAPQASALTRLRYAPIERYVHLQYCFINSAKKIAADRINNLKMKLRFLFAVCGHWRLMGHDVPV
jgi:hypothetical protein